MTATDVLTEDLVLEVVSEGHALGGPISPARQRDLFHGLAAWATHHLADEHGHPLDYSGPFSLMVQPMEDASPRLVLSAASQLGKTQFLLNRLGRVHNEMAVTTLYVMPSQELRSDFFQQRWRPLVENCDWLASRIVPDTAKGRVRAQVDRIGLQMFHGDAGISYIYFLYTGGGRGAGLSIPADILVFDEPDQANGQVLGRFQGRTGASELDWRWYVGNPSFATVGVSELLKQSDWKRWRFPHACGAWQDLLETWPDCIKGEPPKASFVCSACGKPITDPERLRGRWEPTQPGGDYEYSGYHMSRLDSTLHSANRILADCRSLRANTLILNPGQIIDNFIVGVPHASGAAPITREALRAAQERGGHMMMERPGPHLKSRLRAGVDVQPAHFVVTVLADDLILWVGYIQRPDGESWAPLEGFLLERAGVPFTVVDAQPEHRASERVCTQHRRRFARMFYADQPRPTIELRQSPEAEWQYSVDRTALLEDTLDWLAAEARVPKMDDAFFEEWASHICDSNTRILDPGKGREVAGITDTAHSQPVYRLVNPGSRRDDWLHSLAYARAAQRIRPATAHPVTLASAGQRAF